MVTLSTNHEAIDDQDDLPKLLYLLRQKYLINGTPYAGTFDILFYYVDEKILRKVA